jgi:hypothetical protein
MAESSARQLATPARQTSHAADAERARQVRLGAAQDQHAGADGGERDQRAHRGQLAEHVQREHAASSAMPMPVITVLMWGAVLGWIG